MGIIQRCDNDLLQHIHLSPDPDIVCVAERDDLAYDLCVDVHIHVCDHQRHHCASIKLEPSWSSVGKFKQSRRPGIVQLWVRLWIRFEWKLSEPHHYHCRLHYRPLHRHEHCPHIDIYPHSRRPDYHEYLPVLWPDIIPGEHPDILSEHHDSANLDPSAVDSERKRIAVPILLELVAFWLLQLDVVRKFGSPTRWFVDRLCQRQLSSWSNHLI